MHRAQRHALAVGELAAAFGAGLVQELQGVLHRQFGVAGLGGPGFQQTRRGTGVQGLASFASNSVAAMRERSLARLKALRSLVQVGEELVQLANLVQRGHGVSRSHPPDGD